MCLKRIVVLSVVALLVGPSCSSDRKKEEEKAAVQLAFDSVAVHETQREGDIERAAALLAAGDSLLQSGYVAEGDRRLREVVNCYFATSDSFQAQRNIGLRSAESSGSDTLAMSDREFFLAYKTLLLLQQAKIALTLLRARGLNRSASQAENYNSLLANMEQSEMITFVIIGVNYKLKPQLRSLDQPADVKGLRDKNGLEDLIQKYEHLAGMTRDSYAH